MGHRALAGVLLLVDFVLVARGLSHAPTGPATASWALDHSVYSDIIRLTFDHYVHGAQFIHPLPYLHDRIEYPVLLGFSLWLPDLAPGWARLLVRRGRRAMTATATFGSIALIRRQHPPAGLVDRRLARPSSSTPASTGT